MSGLARGGLAGVAEGGGLADGAARSVLGRSAASAGAVADIVATADNTYLGRIAGNPALGFYPLHINTSGGNVVFVGGAGLTGSTDMQFDSLSHKLMMRGEVPGSTYTGLSVTNDSLVASSSARIQVSTALWNVGDAMYTAYLQAGMGWTWGSQRVTGNFCLNQSDGSIGTNDTLQVTPAGSVTWASSSFDVTKAASGAAVTVSARNTSNTASSSARSLIEVGGAAAGDAYTEYSAGSGRVFSVGLDNSANTLNLVPATSLDASTTVGFRMSSTGRVALGAMAPLANCVLALKGTSAVFAAFTEASQNFCLGPSAPDVASTVLNVLASKTVASAAAALWNGVAVGGTLTLTGSTAITTATGVNLVSLQASTISAAAALTVTNAATVYIGGAPAGGGAGPATITNAYALWVDAGLSRFDGDGVRVWEIPADATGNTTAATGRIPVLVGGVTRYVRYYAD